MTVPGSIIVGFVWRILGPPKSPPPHPWAATKKPILNRVKMPLTNCEITLQLTCCKKSSLVAGIAGNQVPNLE